MSFTIQQALIAADRGYATVDVQITGQQITAIAPHLDPVGTVINGKDKLLLRIQEESI